MRDQQLIASKDISNVLSELKNERVLLVRGGNSYAMSGAEAWLKPQLNMENTKSFYGFRKNPDIIDLFDGIKLFREFMPSLVLAVGGGAVIDMAKLIRFFGTIDTAPSDWLDGIDQSVALEPPMPLLAIPTTSGAGAEATHFAVIYRDKVKYSVAHQSLRAEKVILRPELTMSNSPFQTAVSGLDAFFQAVESWWSRNATKESRDYSERAMRLALEHLSPSVHKAAEDSRKGMQEAAYLAGCAINIAKTTACHAFSYVLTTGFGLPHGQAVAVTFPFILDYNLAGMETNDANRLREILGLGDEEPMVFAEKLISDLNLDIKIEISAEELQNLWSENVNIERLNNNPVALDSNVFRNLSRYASRH